MAETETTTETTTETEATTTETETPTETVEEWKGHSRKHETRAKAEKKRADDLQAKIDAIEAAGQSDQDKAIADARKEARDEAKAESDKERRSDRLEVAVTRLAAKGVTVGEGDDAKVVKFSDPEDAQVFIERAIAKGDLDDIYDSEGAVQTDALTTALVDLLKRKPKLAADDAVAPPPGENDAGKGKSSTGRSTDPDEHFKAINKK